MTLIVAKKKQAGRQEQDALSVSRSISALPAKGRSLVLTATALAGLVFGALALLLAYQLLNLGWERKLKPASPARPPTRVIPAP